MPRETLLVVEDEPDILEVLVFNLGREGYRTLAARDGEHGLALARQHRPDLILLDLMLPGMDGLEVCRALQADPATRAIPIIMLTAKGEEADVVLGLGLGADDYVVKPFSPKVLIARVRAVLRRARARPGADAEGPVRVGPLEIDPARHEVRVESRPLSLTPTEFRLLHFLARHPGRVFTREHLIARVIGEETVVVRRNIDVHVRSVRKKLGRHRDLVETVRGVGYRLREA